MDGRSQTDLIYLYWKNYNPLLGKKQRRKALPFPFKKRGASEIEAPYSLF
jgi:hypothetical protein